MDTSDTIHRSGCPIATTLDFVGDKWSLVIIRDLLTGKSKYGELQDSPEGIPTNILANRLKSMVASGLLEKSPYQDRPIRHAYTLTERGKSVKPVLQEMCRWANAQYPDTWVPPESFMRP